MVGLLLVVLVLVAPMPRGDWGRSGSGDVIAYHRSTRVQKAQELTHHRGSMTQPQHHFRRRWWR